MTRIEKCYALLAVAAILCGVSGCSRQTTVTVCNRSGVAVSNVVLSGGSFTNRIATIASGDDKSVRVSVSGESGLRVAFDTGGKRIESAEEGYFEAGYRVTAVIDTNQGVKVSSNVK